MQTKSTHRRLIPVIFYVLIFIFVCIYLQKLDYSKFGGVTLHWWYLLLALPFSLLSRVFLPYIWITLIRIFKKSEIVLNEYWELNYIYAKTWLGKYVPGNVTWVGGKIYFASQKGISKTILGITAVLEAGLQILTALLIGVVFLALSGAYSNFSEAYVIFFVLSSVIGIVSLSPPVFNRFMARGYRVMKKKDLDKKYYIKFTDIFKAAAMYTFVHSLSALPIYFLVMSIGISVSLVDLVYVTGAFIFAGAVGSMAIFVPSGIGIREGIILIFLSSVMSPELGLMLVVLLRLWSVALDVFYWALSFIVHKQVTKGA